MTRVSKKLDFSTPPKNKFLTLKVKEELIKACST